jgi:hypothetical protein
MDGYYPYQIKHIADQLGILVLDDFIGPVRGLDNCEAGRKSAGLLLQRWRHHDATDPQDKVYALMSTFPTSPFPNLLSCRNDISSTELFTRGTYDLIGIENGLRPWTAIEASLKSHSLPTGI